MSSVLLRPLLSIFMVSAVALQLPAQRLASNAAIVILADSSIGQNIYLERFILPGRDYLFDYVAVDSQAIGIRTPVRFTFTPDPSKMYCLRVGKERVQYDLVLAPGDSLVFRHSPHHDTLLFDKLGANRAYREDPARPLSQYDFYKDMGELDWDETAAYSSAISDKIESHSRQFGASYLEHWVLANELHAEAIRWRFEPPLRQLYDYWDSTNMPVVKAPNRLMLLDSIPWTDTAFCRSQDIWGLSSSWLNLSVLRWQRAGIDTAGKRAEEYEFELASALPKSSRDIAMLGAISDLVYFSPVEAEPIAVRWMNAFRQSARDTSYVAAYESKLALIRSHLPGQPAPEFSLPDTAGKIISLSSFRGKVVYLEFWGTWCGPCLEELPAALALQKKFENDPSVQFVSVALESRRLAKWKSFVKYKQLRGTQLYAEGQFNNEVPRKYGLFGVPTFILIDRSGNLISLPASRPSSPKAEQAIREAIAHP